jgi:hypothetical protein
VGPTAAAREGFLICGYHQSSGGKRCSEHRRGFYRHNAFSIPSRRFQQERGNPALLRRLHSIDYYSAAKKKFLEVSYETVVRLNCGVARSACSIPR